MALHPLRDALAQAGLRASRLDSMFKPLADAALERFQELREDLERQVRRGDMTPKVARDKAATAAAELKARLVEQAARHNPAPRAFLDRLIEASDARQRSRDHGSIESLQRETNRLLRQTLVEQQLVTRAFEFEGRTAVRSMPGGKPAPTLATLLAFHETVTQAGDEAAREWARRQLESFRPIAPDPRDQRKIDLACDRPETVNERLVAQYVEALADADRDGLERFVAEALRSRDASACVAAFLIARRDPAGGDSRLSRMVLNGLGEFPDAALATLRVVEAETRAVEVEAARAQAEFAAAIAESDGKLKGLEAPSEGDLARQARAERLPVAALGEPIGLSLQRRGTSPVVEPASTTESPERPE